MLEDKVCVVAGGGNGIGEAVAIELGSHGVRVVVNDLGSNVQGEGESSKPAVETVEAVCEAGGEGIAHFGDIASLEYTESLIEDTVKEYGRVDSVMNFAGILRDSISYRMSGEDFDQVVRVHLRGHFALLRSAGAHWREVAKGTDDVLPEQRSFLGVSSKSALGSPGQVNYSAAKAGVLGMMRTAAAELDRLNIRVNALVPTAFTRMIADLPEEGPTIDEEELLPEKIAPLVAFLASDHAEDITGCTIRGAGDHIGMYSDPEITRLGFQEGGWEADQIADHFRTDVAQGIELDKSDPMV